MSFTLPDLPYKYDALAPYMSRETLEYHHDKHHLAYVNNANQIAQSWAELGTMPIEKVLSISPPCPKTCAPACATMSAVIGIIHSSGS